MSADEPPGTPATRERASADEPADPAHSAWWVYQGTGRPLRDVRLADLLPPPPPWRRFGDGPFQEPPPPEDGEADRKIGPVPGARIRRPDAREADAVNAAIYLRRPLLVTGRPGVGKSSLALRISRELRLGRVLRWPIGSRSTLRDGLYLHDPIGRVYDAAARRGAAPVDGGEDRGSAPSRISAPSASPAETDSTIGDYIKLGPLGTALLPYELPRVLLIDELDKSDMDLPNDLLDVFEEGMYRIPELERVAARAPEIAVHSDDPGRRVRIERGLVRCGAFPIIVITSNGERDFPAPFLRRCLRYTMEQPDEDRLADMVAGFFAGETDQEALEIIRRFLDFREMHSDLAIDQLLNAVYLATSGVRENDGSWERLLEVIWQRLRGEAVAE